MTRRVLVDRWGLVVLYRGHRARGRDGESFDEYLIAEREYLRFLRAVDAAERRFSTLRVIEDVQRALDSHATVYSALGTLLSTSQVYELYGMPLSIARVPSDAVGLLPVVSDQFGLVDADAESLLLARIEQVPFLACFRTIHPRFWKALYLYGVAKFDLQHCCPDLKTPRDWYRHAAPKTS